MGATEVAIRQRLSRTRQQLKTELLEGEKDTNGMIAISAICAFLLGSATLAWAGMFKDDFEDGNLVGWQEVWWEVPGNWTVETGQLVLDCSNHGDAPAYQTLADVVVDDVTMEFDAQMEQLFQNMNIVNIELTLRLQKPDFVFLPIGRWDNQWFAGGGLFWRGRVENWHQVPFPFFRGMFQKYVYTFLSANLCLSNQCKVILWEF